MKFLKINGALAYLIGFALFVSIFSCTDDNVFTDGNDETVDFSEFGVNYDNKGAIVFVSDVDPTFFNLFEPATTNIAFNVDSQGEAVSSAKMWISRNGSDPIPFADITSLPANFDISLTEAATALGISPDDFMGGDVVTFSFSDVTSAAGVFPSGYTFNVDASCPSAIMEGTYNSVTTGLSTDACCPDPVTVEGTVELTSDGAGLYTISDWSAGIYLAWYEVYGITASTDISGSLKDVCNTISANGITEPFGTAVEATGTYDPATGIITYEWSNGYADSATVTLTPQ